MPQASGHDEASDDSNNYGSVQPSLHRSGHIGGGLGHLPSNTDNGVTFEHRGGNGTTAPEHLVEGNIRDEAEESSGRSNSGNEHHDPEKATNGKKQYLGTLRKSCHRWSEPLRKWFDRWYDPLRISLHRRYEYLGHWKWKLSALMFAYSLFAVVIIILFIYDGRSLSQWHPDISINLVASVSSTVGTFTLMNPVSAAIGQTR